MRKFLVSALAGLASAYIWLAEKVAGVIEDVNVALDVSDHAAGRHNVIRPRCPVCVESLRAHQAMLQVEWDLRAVQAEEFRRAEEKFSDGTLLADQTTKLKRGR